MPEFMHDICIFQDPPAGFEGSDFYSNLLLSENMDIICETEKRLKEAGVNLEDLHVEPAPGQFEFNYQPAWGILGSIKHCKNIYLM